MRSRGGDRRGYARFEIVGTLMGMFETWRAFGVREIGLYGALLETTEPFAPGTRLRGRLTVRSEHQQMQADVRHSRVSQSRDMPPRYLVSLAFPERLSGPVGDLITEETMDRERRSGTAGESRQDRRIRYTGEAEFWLHTIVNVELRDISLGGTMFVAPTALEPGISGQLSLEKPRLAAEIEVRRLESQGGDPSRFGYRIAASFVSLDEENRRGLATFLTPSEN